MREKYLGDKKIYYKINSRTGAKNLIFIHGVWGSSSALIPYADEFAKDYNVILIDLRGHGKSFKPDEYSGYSLDKFAKDIYDVIRKEKLKKVILIGNSFGNFVILEFLKKHQNFVEKAILISPYYNLKRIKLTKITKYLVYAISGLYHFIPQKKERRERDYKKYMNRHNGDWELIRRVFPDMLNTGLRTSLICLKQSYDYNGEKILKKITIPVVIIHGKKDSVIPLNYAKEMASRIKNCKVQIIENGNHIMALNNPKELKKIIKDVLNTPK